MIAFYRLFKYATPYDYCLMALGTLGAVINGAAIPVFSLILGSMTDEFGMLFDGYECNRTSNSGRCVRGGCLEVRDLLLLHWVHQFLRLGSAILLLDVDRVQADLSVPAGVLQVPP